MNNNNSNNNDICNNKENVIIETFVFFSLCLHSSLNVDEIISVRILMHTEKFTNIFFPVRSPNRK